MPHPGPLHIVEREVALPKSILSDTHASPRPSPHSGEGVYLVSLRAEWLIMAGRQYRRGL